MDNNFLFPDLGEEEVVTAPTIPNQDQSTFSFSDIQEEEEPSYNTSTEPTLPSQEGGDFLFNDIEEDEEE